MARRPNATTDFYAAFEFAREASIAAGPSEGTIDDPSVRHDCETIEIVAPDYSSITWRRIVVAISASY